MNKHTNTNRSFLIKEALKNLKNNGIVYMLTKESPEFERLKDVDILISKIDVERAVDIIEETLLNYAPIKLLKYKKLPGVKRVGYLVKTEKDFIFLKFDFIYFFDYKGMKILESEKYLDWAVKNEEGILVSPPEIEFLIIVVKELIKGKGKRILLKYKKRLEKILEQNQKEKLKRLLSATFSEKIAVNLIELPSTHQEDLLVIRKKIILYLFWKHLKENPLKLLCNSITYALKMVIFYLKKGGLFIAFYGPDGSGKSTLIEELEKDIQIPYFSEIKKFRLRPAIFPYIGEKVLKDNKMIKGGNPYIKEPYGCFASLVKIIYYSLDYIIGYWVKIRILLSKECLIVFDRYFLDLIVDQRRARIRFNRRFLYLIYKFFIPKPDFNVLLVGHPAVLTERKRELSPERISYLIEEYLRLIGRTRRGLILDSGNLSVAEAKKRVIYKIFGFLKK